MTMEELHRHGGVPPGWQFTLPAGNLDVGRQVFIDMKCYACHTVAGEKFPAHQRDIGDVGPDLTGMGAFHPAAYFAEAIINPNAVIVLGDGYSGPDGLSRMPEYNDSLTLAQLIDLVAYLKSLQAGPEKTGSGMHHGSHLPHKGHAQPGMPSMPATGHQKEMKP
jgi:mono/diheme cytochrome c family protein